MEVHYFCPPFFFLAAILLEAAKKCLQVKTKEADRGQLQSLGLKSSSRCDQTFIFSHPISRKQVMQTWLARSVLRLSAKLGSHF